MKTTNEQLAVLGMAVELLKSALEGQDLSHYRIDLVHSFSPNELSSIYEECEKLNQCFMTELVNIIGE